MPAIINFEHYRGSTFAKTLWLEEDVSDDGSGDWQAVDLSGHSAVMRICADKDDRVTDPVEEYTTVSGELVLGANGSTVIESANVLDVAPGKYDFDIAYTLGSVTDYHYAGVINVTNNTPAP